MRRLKVFTEVARLNEVHLANIAGEWSPAVVLPEMIVKVAALRKLGPAAFVLAVEVHFALLGPAIVNLFNPKPISWHLLEHLGQLLVSLGNALFILGHLNVSLRAWAANWRGLLELMVL